MKFGMFELLFSLQAMQSRVLSFHFPDILRDSDSESSEFLNFLSTCFRLISTFYSKPICFFDYQPTFFLQERALRPEELLKIPAFQKYDMNVVDHESDPEYELSSNRFSLAVGCPEG